MLRVLVSQVSMLFFFFFSSRRRHTRSLCDWSSDVCSSDLQQALVDFASVMTNPEERKNALNQALSGSVPDETKKIATETHDARWLEEDRAKRSRIRE